MSDKKEQYRVKRPWVGGPVAGTVIKGPVHPALLPNVEKVVGASDEAGAKEKAGSIISDAENSARDYLKDTQDAANAARDKIIADAQAEADKIVAQARTDADAILNGAKAEADKIVADAKHANKR
jgi:vacuolar-type H+-ATPase subunit H